MMCAAWSPQRIFLSYNHRDEDTVSAIQALLRESGALTFLDRTSLPVGLPWGPALDQAMRSSGAVIVVIGPHGIGAWQEREIYYALDRQVEARREGAEFRVVPVLLPGAPVDVVPGFLRQITWLELRADEDLPPLVQEVMAALAGASGREPSSIRDICPFRGLRTFREIDSGYFFGRKVLIDKLLTKVTASVVTVVVGVSGSGKSSVVQAGLIPKLRPIRSPEPTWDVAIFKPGAHPFRSLADAITPFLTPPVAEGQVAADLQAGNGALESAIRRAMSRPEAADQLLLVVDQLEELFTMTPEAHRRPFLESLLESTRSVSLRLIFTVRADYYGQAIEKLPALGDAWSDGHVVAVPMSRDELAEAIEGPAKLVGITFEAGLVKRILDDLDAQPGALPLLEYALTNLWEHARSHDRYVFTHDSYTMLGEIEDAITKRAEELYASLSPAEQNHTRRLMSRLVRVTEIETERGYALLRATRGDIGEAAWAVARKFADSRYRLLVLGTPGSADEADQAVEPAHEALIRNWKRLRNWLEQDRAFLLWHQQFAGYAKEWARRGRPRELLLRGSLLKEARLQSRGRLDFLGPVERWFLRASRLASLRSRIAVAASLSVLIVAGGVGTCVWLYLRTDLYTFHKILWTAPELIFDARATPPESGEDYLFALGLTGQPVLTEVYSREPGLDEEAERFASFVFQLRGNFEAASLPEPPQSILRGLVAAGAVDTALRITKWSRNRALIARLAYSSGDADAARKIVAREVAALQNRIGSPDQVDAVFGEMAMWSATAWLIHDRSLAQPLIERIDGRLAEQNRKLRIGNDDASFLAEIGRLDQAIGIAESAEGWWPSREQAIAEYAGRIAEFTDVAEASRLIKSLNVLAGSRLVQREMLEGRWDLAANDLQPWASKRKRKKGEYFDDASLTAVCRAFAVRSDVESAFRCRQLRLRSRVSDNEQYSDNGQDIDVGLLLAQAGRMGEAAEIYGRLRYGLKTEFAVIVVRWMLKQEPRRVDPFLCETRKEKDYVLALAGVYDGQTETATQWGARRGYPADGVIRDGLLVRAATARFSSIDEAKQALGKVSTAESRTMLGASIAREWILRNRIPEALALSHLIYPAMNERDALEALARMSEAYHNPLATGVFNHYALIRMATNLDGAGLPQVALALLRTARQSAVATSSGTVDIAWLARAYAGIGRFQDAREVADLCSTPERLWAYAAILREYAVKKHPLLRASVGKVEPFGVPQFMDR